MTPLRVKEALNFYSRPKTIGTVYLNDTVPSDIMNKDIPIGSDKREGKMFLGSNSTGILIFFDTDKTHTMATGYHPGNGGAKSRMVK